MSATEKLKITVTKQTLEKLREKWLLLDTNIFIDATNYPEDFSYLFEKLEEADCHVVTISSVAMEFLRGSKSVADLQKKKALLEGIAAVIPTGEMTANKGHVDLMEPEFLIAYAKSGTKVDYTDYLLAKTLKNFEANMYIATGNHKDFPTSIFDREHIITLSLERNIQNYGILKFNKKKYESIMSRLLKQETTHH